LIAQDCACAGFSQLSVTSVDPVELVVVSRPLDTRLLLLCLLAQRNFPFGAQRIRFLACSRFYLFLQMTEMCY